MKKMIYSGLVLCFLWMGNMRLEAQIVYGTYFQGGNTNMALIDLATCTACVVFEVPGGISAQDISVLPDGNIAFQGTYGLAIFAPPSSNSTTIPLDPPDIATGSFFFNNLLYIYAYNGLHTYDPLTNQVNYLGPWPSNFPFADFEFYEYNNQIYAMAGGGNPVEIWQIDLNTPENSTFVQSFNALNSIASVTSVGNNVILATEEWLYFYDHITNTVTQECELASMGIFGSLSSMSYIPSGVPTLPCLCTTDAGTVAVLTSEICLPNDAVVPFNNDETLDGDDLLQYILFSDPLDTLGSTITVSNTPNISFDPNTMQTGVTYYIATIAGDNLNGNVNLNDDCLSISNASEVIWWPQPSVSFSANNANLCSGDCTILDVNFIGNAPFTLTGEIISNSSVIETFSNTYNSTSGTLEICIPTGISIGNILIQATNLSDNNCNCQ